jgi:hypothetical protein
MPTDLFRNLQLLDPRFDEPAAVTMKGGRFHKNRLS